MSQSRFSIVLVGVSALLRRPLVSRLRPADGERSSWVVFAARGCRFDSGFRSVSWPSGSLLPLFGTHRFGVAAGRVRSFAFRFGNCPRRVESSSRRVGLRASASAFRHAPLRSGRWASSFFRLPLRSFRSASWPSGSLLPLFGTRRFGDCPRRVSLRAHRFRFSACTASELPLGELAFGLLLRKLPSAG